MTDLSIDPRAEFARTVNTMRAITDKPPRGEMDPVHADLWISWEDALEWWGDIVGLTKMLLKYGWRPGSIPGKGWKPGIEPIFWETIKANATGGVSA